MNADIFRSKARNFDPLGIGAWAPLSEFDYMIPIIEDLAGLSEREFIAQATAYFMGCFSGNELVRSEEDVEFFFKDLFHEITK